MQIANRVLNNLVAVVIPENADAIFSSDDMTAPAVSGILCHLLFRVTHCYDVLCHLINQFNFLW